MAIVLGIIGHTGFICLWGVGINAEGVVREGVVVGGDGCNWMVAHWDQARCRAGEDDGLARPVKLGVDSGSKSSLFLPFHLDTLGISHLQLVEWGEKEVGEEGEDGGKEDEEKDG